MNWFALLVTILFVFCVFYIIIPWGIGKLLRRKFLYKLKKSGLVCLTFDDGPDPKSTPEILRTLKEADIKATFFVIGENVNKYPDLALKITEMGHEIGGHSYQHIHPWKSRPFHSLQDIIRGNQIINKYLSSDKPFLFRPPYGKFNLITLLYVLFSGYRVVFWNIDPKDYEQKTADGIAAYLMERLSPGSIILLHDGRSESNDSGQLTALAVRMFLAKTKNKGIKFAKVSEI